MALKSDFFFFFFWKRSSFPGQGDQGEPSIVCPFPPEPSQFLKPGIFETIRDNNSESRDPEDVATVQAAGHPAAAAATNEAERGPSRDKRVDCEDFEEKRQTKEPHQIGSLRPRSSATFILPVVSDPHFHLVPVWMPDNKKPSRHETGRMVLRLFQMNIAVHHLKKKKKCN